MKRLKKILKIVSAIIVVLFLVLYFLFVNFSSPKSNEEVIEEFAESFHKPLLTTNTYKGFEYRVVSMQKEIDTSKTTLVFVHGAPGSLLDFKKYLADSLLNTKANMISYDRIGYNYKDKNTVQKLISFEVEILHDVLKNLKKTKTIIVGYSYGGPIALAVKEKYKSIVLIAPAVYSKVEPMPFMLNFYKWKATRWLVPAIWQSASEEKRTHKSELRKIENNWTTNPSQIICIQGNDDGIVPYENSLFLQQQFPAKQFKLITIPETGHALVWTQFELIKEEILKQVN
ncbi:alpha/beta fold hydrolase [Polaribacter huanghezhanensis]|uniref:alpha/beta fold hydrolase n=1 Tax=Polaribacter huanghezhanensis TaxID=1354726 RepID=UPI002647DDCC|nr:alpha/beta fold hydrolase [Polaribacter huanghezhanensis]